MSPDIIVGTLVTLGLAALAGVVWLVRLEGNTNSNKDKITEANTRVDKVDLRVEKLELRHDTVSNEMRNLIYNIQRSVANTEGRLGISSKDQRD